jgi:hypothetical protein
MRRNKKLTISKRAKGFPIKLSNSHVLSLHQTYAWLKSKGLTDPLMDEGIKAIPEWDDPVNEAQDVGLAQIAELRWLKALSWRSVTRMRTYRIRSGQIKSVVRLFRVVSKFMVGNQNGRVFNRRADALANVPVLDRLVDAGR